MNNIYSILKGIIETEKTMQKLQPMNKYTFIVSNEAWKIDIRNAVETMYNVTVTSVNTVPVRKKTRLAWRWKTIIKRKAFTKAIVTLKSWDKIDVAAVQEQKTKDGK